MIHRVLVIFDFLTDNIFPTADNDDDIVARQVLLKESTEIDTVIEQLTAIVDKQTSKRKGHIKHSDLVDNVMRASGRSWLYACDNMILNGYRVIRI